MVVPVAQVNVLMKESVFSVFQWRRKNLCASSRYINFTVLHFFQKTLVFISVQSFWGNIFQARSQVWIGSTRFNTKDVNSRASSLKHNNNNNFLSFIIFKRLNFSLYSRFLWRFSYIQKIFFTCLFSTLA